MTSRGRSSSTGRTSRGELGAKWITKAPRKFGRARAPKHSKDETLGQIFVTTDDDGSLVPLRVTTDDDGSFVPTRVTSVGRPMTSETRKGFEALLDRLDSGK